MVTVRKLISELKKMPQNLKVGVSMHDNTEYEVAAWVSQVYDGIEDFSDYSDEDENGEPCVFLRC